MLERQLLHESGKTVQDQEHKCAYELEGLDSPPQELARLPVCSDHHIELDNGLSLLPRPVDRLRGALLGLSFSILLRQIQSRLLSGLGSLEPLPQGQNQVPMPWLGLKRLWPRFEQRTFSVPQSEQEASTASSMYLGSTSVQGCCGKRR